MSEVQYGNTISVDQISRTPAEVPPEEKTSVTEDPFTGLDRRFDQELGRVGRFIGGGKEKAGNIAYITVASAIVILLLSAIVAGLIEKPASVETLNKVVTGCITLITGALGYIFGSSSAKSDR
jgi:hypothetical protein